MTNGKKTILKAILIEKLDNGDVKVHDINKFKNCVFYCPEDEYCYKLKVHLKYILKNENEEIELYLCKRETDSQYFFCHHFQEVGDKSEGTCGRMCKGYQPRNGKSGACRHYGYTYEPTDRCFTLKIVN